MQAGLYEQVVSLVLERQLEGLPSETVCLERLDQADTFFTTLNKAEKHYSPTTMYEDYAISDTLFHWQSQSRTTEESDTGKRYIQHKRRNHLILLFVREERNNSGNLVPFPVRQFRDMQNILNYFNKKGCAFPS